VHWLQTSRYLDHIHMKISIHSQFL
jgi:hypothetical protein